MEIIYLDCTDEDTYIPDYKRKVKDQHFIYDPYFEDKWLIDEKLQPYTLDDCALVRTTEAFPFNHEIHTPAYDHAYDFGDSMYLNDALYDILCKKYPDAWMEESKKYAVYSPNPRQTLHFTLNGFVQSHMMGNFEDRDFIIIEPLKYHIDESLCALRPEDTYFKGNLQLSNESALVISEEKYEQIKNDPKYSKDLENYRLFIYTGKNQVLAVNQALNEMGYDGFLMSNNYFTNGSSKDYPAKEMTDFLVTFCKQNEISQSSHFYSEERAIENEERITLAQQIDGRHLRYILENGQVSSEIKEKVLEQIEYNPSWIDKDLMKKIIDQIGLDNLAILTKQFNEMMISENAKVVDETNKHM